MMRLFTVILHFLFLFGKSNQNASPQKLWALLVAGSHGYWNYRHQADVCHAYHIVRKHGIPAERIIVMMYDDIANSKLNPFPGTIINEPNGENVYPGVIKDYTGDEVTPEVFLKVLSGDADGVKQLLGREGKVIKSGPNDRIFVNIVDHGAAGIIRFPNGVLHADDLNEVLVRMHKNKQYKQMVLYVEACESGSMFDNILRKDMNIYVTTAAKPDELTHSCYWDDKRGTFLGDVYSVNWMQDSDVEELEKKTLKSQYELVKKETNTSHVMEYGDLSMNTLSVGDFQGNNLTENAFFRSSVKHNPNIDAVRSEDVPMEILKRKNDYSSNETFKKLIDLRDSTKKYFEDVVISASRFNYWDLHEASIKFSDFKCYKASIDQIMKECPGLNIVKNDYASRGLRVLANLCETDTDLGRILLAIHQISNITPLCAAQ